MLCIHSAHTMFTMSHIIYNVHIVHNAYTMYIEGNVHMVHSVYIPWRAFTIYIIGIVCIVDFVYIENAVLFTKQLQNSTHTVKFRQADSK